MDIGYLVKNKPESINVTLKKIKRGTFVTIQNELNSNIYLIKSGKIIIGKSTEDGEFVFFDLLEKNECFGDLELFSDSISLYDAKATTDCEIYCISYSDIKKWMIKDFNLTKYLYVSLSSKLKKSSNSIVKANQNTIYEQLLTYIYKYSDSKKFDINKKDLALRFNTTVRTINRSLKKASQEGFISIHNNVLVILSTDKFHSYLNNLES